MPKLASGRKVAAPTDTWGGPMVRRLDEAGLDGGATLNEEAGRASSAPRFSYRARRRRLLRRAPTYVADILLVRRLHWTNACWECVGSRCRAFPNYNQPELAGRVGAGRRCAVAVRLIL